MTERFGMNSARLIVCGALVTLIGCAPPPVKPNLTGANETFVTSGSADDADDVNTPPAGNRTYSDPARMIADGPSSAESDPQSFRALNGTVVAEIGRQPRQNGKATAVSNNKVTSTFTVAGAAVNCQFRISTTGVPNLDGGTAEVRFVARILDSAGTLVAGSDFQKLYQYTEKTNTTLNILEDGTKIGEMQDGGIHAPTDTGPTPAFTLNPGTYTLQFEVNLQATGVDTKGRLRVASSVTLI